MAEKPFDTSRLDNYNTVAERIAEAKMRHPDGRFQSTILELPAAFADKFIAVEVRFYRSYEDDLPAVAMAWEPVPGKTPYTRDSELMNAETSAWGRALVAAFAADAKKGIASREEVQNRQPEPRQRSGMQRTPRKPADDWPFQSGPPGEVQVTLTAPPEGQEKPSNGPVSHLTPDQAITIATMKKDLLARTEGDKVEASRLWKGTLETFSLNPSDPIPADMIPILKTTLEALAIKGEE